MDIRILEARQPLPGPGVTQPVVSKASSGGGLSDCLLTIQILKLLEENRDTAAKSSYI